MDTSANDPTDCLVIGGGPAGMTAAIYLARFHLSVRVVDAGQSRVTWIPRTHNHAGYPGGITGVELLERMREQATEFGIRVEQGLVERLARTGEGFDARIADGEPISARTVLLATGVVNKQPPISPELHAVAMKRGLIRYCPICDGYEVTDKRVGVIGNRTHGFKEAVFLRTYTRDVTLIAPDQDVELSDEENAKLRELGIEAVGGPCASLRVEDDRIVAPTPRVRQRLPGAGLRDPVGAGDGAGGGRLVGRLPGRRRSPADQRARAVRRGRRGARAEPDQPRDGRRRRGGDDAAQRPGGAGAALALAGHSTKAASTIASAPSSTAVIETMNRLPVGRSISRTSPAPKFSTATIRPSSSPSVERAQSPIRSA